MVLPCRMEYLILLLALVIAFIAWAPEAVTQAGLAFVWLLGILFIVGEVLYYSGRFFLTLL